MSTRISRSIRAIAAVAAIGMALSGAFTASAALAEGGRGAPKPGKKLDFEDGVVEGLNKRPLDAFHQMSEADKGSKMPHLYKKRGDFADKTAETVKQVRYAQ
jgi:hypothetical protein